MMREGEEGEKRRDRMRGEKEREMCEKKCKKREE